MRKLLIFMLVLGMASAANAVLKISVDGVVDPCDTTITLYPSDTVEIDIWGDGQTSAPQDAYLIIQGPGSINGHVMLHGGSLSKYEELAEVAANIGITEQQLLDLMSDTYGYTPPPTTDLSYMNFAHGDSPQIPLDGTLVNGIIFHCIAEGDVTLTLTDLAGTTFDTQIIHQLPEPMTVFLLGLGGLFLRRRK
jgi:hypothetical protein